MIQKTITYSCHSCNSINIVKNGTNKCGNQQYHCLDCGAYRVLNAQHQKEHPDKAKVLRAYRERVSLRGLARIFGICRKTIMGWLIEEAEELPALTDTLLPAQQNDVLELDEAWSFVAKKQEKRLIWNDGIVRCVNG